MLSGGVLLVLLAGAASIDIETPAPDRMTISVNAAPLADVLERVGRQTGMSVVYEGPPPRQPITLRLEARTPVAAVLGILEGLGLNYALVMDQSGTRVQTLMFPAAAAGPRPPPLPQAQTQVRAQPTPAPPAPDAEDNNDDSDSPEAAAEAQPEKPKPAEPGAPPAAPPNPPSTLPSGLPTFGSNPFGVPFPGRVEAPAPTPEPAAPKNSDTKSPQPSPTPEPQPKP